jgi:hypothetical protein
MEQSSYAQQTFSKITHTVPIQHTSSGIGVTKIRVVWLQVSLTGQCGADFGGDLALDDITIRPGSCAKGRAIY